MQGIPCIMHIKPRSCSPCCEIPKEPVNPKPVTIKSCFCHSHQNTFIVHSAANADGVIFVKLYYLFRGNLTSRKSLTGGAEPITSGKNKIFIIYSVSY